MALGAILSSSPALRVEDHLPWHTWRELVGHRVANRTQPLRVERGILHVKVTSSAWASELSLLQVPLLKKLKQFYPNIHALRFRVGTVSLPSSPPPAGPVVSADLPAPLLEKINELDDAKLSAVLREAAALSLGRQQRGR